MPLFKILNFGLFQAGWFAAAYWKDSSLWLMFALLGLHFLMSPSKRSDLKLLMMLLPIGLAMEVLMISLGLVSFNSSLFLPVWMIGLWCLLILSFNHSLKWFRDIPLIFQILMSAVAGLASYLAATKFDALVIGDPMIISAAIIALVWAVQLPIMMRITKQVNAEGVSCVDH